MVPLAVQTLHGFWAGVYLKASCAYQRLLCEESDHTSILAVCDSLPAAASVQCWMFVVSMPDCDEVT